MQYSDLKAYIAAEREKIIEFYKINTNQLLSDYQSERSTIHEYNGRQLLELIQNADDAASSAKEKVCFISLKGNNLIVANNGEKFSRGGFDSLMYSNLSPKAIEQNKIGHKGLGFRSVLSWANRVTIKSYDIAVEFSERYSRECFDKYLKANPDIEVIKKSKGCGDVSCPIAILRCPCLLDEVPEYTQRYDTFIELDLKENQTDKVKYQISDDVNMELMLFLNHLDKIIVESPDSNFTISKIYNKQDQTVTIVWKDESRRVDKTWHIRTKTGEISGKVETEDHGERYENKRYELKIAWNDNLDDNKNVLYSYFKTTVSFPFPALVHGTFDLKSDRNSLIRESDFNIGLKEELIDFIIEIAVEISKESVSYKPLKLLHISDNPLIALDEIIKKIKSSKAKILPSVAGKYISVDDSPCFLRNNYVELIEEEKRSLFPSLLQYTTDQSIVDLLTMLGVSTLPNEEFITKFTSLPLTVEARAKAVHYVTNERFCIIKPRNLSQILIDNNGNAVLCDDELYLPPTGQTLKIPEGLRLKIINSDLYEQLKKLFNVSNADVMVDKLRNFEVKAYQFASVFNTVVQTTLSSTNDRQYKFNILLLGKLYELYSINKNTGVDMNISFSKTNVYVLNREGKVVKTTDVYLGEDYGCNLCEKLYHYDQSKFIASAEVLGLNGKSDLNGFLQWLQVADNPRYKLTEVEKEYGYWVLDKFPFSEKTIWGISRKDMEDYNCHVVKAYIVDGLSDILRSNNNETILFWLLKDKRITTNITEQDESKVFFHCYNGKTYPYIDHKDMPSYLLWKLPRIEWLNTKNGKATPSRCCLNKTISDEFSPIIEVPEINYSEIKGFSKFEIESLLHTLGVKTDIREFQMQTIYSILNRLSENGVDEDGKKAKTIYRELVDNLEEDDIDVNSQYRKIFLETGKVLCKKGNILSYQQVNDVYYLQDKIYGENIVSQFNTIAIDRRKNSTVIQKMFGVEPLANLKFSLAEQPIKNDALNEELQKELIGLNPYIYALRHTTLRSSNTRNTDYSKLNNDWNVIVCSKISPVYKKHNEDEGHGFVLNDYEFVFVAEENRYYVLLKNSESTNLKELKADFRFAEVIAEIYSNILKVDSIRPTVSRLFEANTEKRKFIINGEIDDCESVLDDARKKLNVVNDQKVLFWLGVLNTIGHSPEYKDYNRNELEELVKVNLEICIDDYNIDFNELSSKRCSGSVIQKLFCRLEIDIDKYNRNSSCKIDLIPYYKKCLLLMKKNKEPLFIRLLYDNLKDKSVDYKRQFIGKIQDYKRYEDFSIVNSIKSDVEYVFYECISKAFGLNLNDSISSDDINKLFRQYYDNLKDKCGEKVDELKLLIDEDDELRSLVYFNELDVIIDVFRHKQEADQSDNNIKIDGKNIQAVTPEEIYKQISELSITCPIDQVGTVKIPNDNRGGSGSGRGGRKGITRVSDKRKKEIGFIGESVVYNTLKEKYGDSVSWDSAYAKEANVNPLGNDSNHYDIRYEKDGEYYYVEIKSTISENLEFEISQYEYEFGVGKGENYKIFIVTNVDNQNRKIKDIGNPFIFKEGESLTNNPRFSMFNDKFVIKMKEFQQF